MQVSSAPSSPASSPVPGLNNTHPSRKAASCGYCLQPEFGDVRHDVASPNEKLEAAGNISDMLCDSISLNDDVLAPLIWADREVDGMSYGWRWEVDL